MKQPNEPLQSIYKDLALESEGIDFDTFSKTFNNNPDARRSIYNDLGMESAGIAYDVFEERLGIKKKDHSEPVSQNGLETPGLPSYTSPTDTEYNSPAQTQQGFVDEEESARLAAEMNPTLGEIEAKSAVSSFGQNALSGQQPQGLGSSITSAPQPLGLGGDAEWVGSNERGMNRRALEALGVYSDAQGVDPLTIGDSVPSEQQVIDNIQSVKNSVRNTWTRIQGSVPRLKLVTVDVMEKTLGKDLAESWYANDPLNPRDLNQVRRDAYSRLEELENQQLPTKDLLSSISSGDALGIGAGVIDAMSSLASTAVASMATGGAGLFTEMIGESIYDFQKVKAEKMGMSVEELYEQGHAELGVPMLIGGFAGGLERIGLKGVQKAMSGKLTGSVAKKLSTVAFDVNKEGATEFFQEGADAINQSLAAGDSTKEAISKGVDKMFSEDGLRAYIMGVAGSGGATAVGRITKRITAKSEKDKANKAYEAISNIMSDLENPELSDNARVFLEGQIESQARIIAEAVSSDADIISELPGESQRDIEVVSGQISEIQQTIEDPSVSDNTKEVLGSQISALDSEIESIISEPKSRKTVNEILEEYIPAEMADKVEKLAEVNSEIRDGRSNEEFEGSPREAELVSERRRLENEINELNDNPPVTEVSAPVIPKTETTEQPTPSPELEVSDDTNKEAVADWKKGKDIVQPSKPIEEMNSEEMHDYAQEVRSALRKQDKEFANKSEQEKEDAGYYDFVDTVPDLRDASQKINYIESAESLDDLANSVKSALSSFDAKNPSRESLAILNAARVKSEEMNISPNDLIKSVLTKVGREHADAADAKLMMDVYANKIAPNKESSIVNEPVLELAESNAEAEAMEAVSSNLQSKTEGELAEMYQAEAWEPSTLSVNERAIVEVLGDGFKVDRDSFTKGAGDKNYLGASIGRSYFPKKGEKAPTADQLAEEVNTEYFNGENVITEEDIAQFMYEFPNGSYTAVTPAGNPVLKAINEEYKARTGKSLNRRTAVSIAEKYRASEQQVNEVKSNDALIQEVSEVMDAEGNLDFGKVEQMLENNPEALTVFPGNLNEADISNLRQIIEHEKSQREQQAEAERESAIEGDGRVLLPKREDGPNERSEQRVLQESESIPETEGAVESAPEPAMQAQVESIPESSTIAPEVEIVAEKPKPKAGDAAREFANKVRQGKINKLSGFRAGTGFDAVWDGSLEVVALSIEGGAKVADAIQAGLENVKATQWYKDLENKKDFDRQYIDHLNESYVAESKAQERVSGIKKALVEESIVNSTQIERMPRKRMLELGEKFVKTGEVDPVAVINEIAGYKPKGTISDKVGSGMMGLLGIETAGTPRALQPKEVVALIWHKAQMDTQYEALLKESNGLVEQGLDPSAVNRRIELMRFDLEQYQVMSLITAQQQSLAFSLRQGLLDSNFNIVSFVEEYKKTNKGYISPEQEAKFREMADELDRVTTQLKELEQANQERIDNDIAEAIIQDVMRESKNPLTRKDKAKKIVKSIENFQKKLRSKTYESTIGVPVAIIDAGLTVTKKAITAGASIADAVEAGVVRINQLLKGKKWKENEFRSDIINSLESEGLSDTINIPHVTSDGKIIIPNAYIRSIVQDGATTIQDMVADVKEQLDDPEITDREIRDAITQYGKTINKSKDQISETIGKAKRIGKLYSELDDLEKGKQKAKTGKRLSEINKEENDLKQRIRKIEDSLELSTEEVAEYSKFKNEERIQYLNNYIEQQRNKIKNKDFAPKKSKEYSKSPELIKKEIEANLIREEFEAARYKNELDNRPAAVIVYDRIKELVTGFNRALVAGADLSATFVQGAIVATTRPAIGGKSFINSIIAASGEKSTSNYFAKIKSDGNYDIAKLSGVALQEPSLKLDAKDSALQGGAVNQIWEILVSPTKLLDKAFGTKINDRMKKLNPYRAGERAYAVGMTDMRLNLFAEYAASLARSGYTYESDPAEFKRAANLVNNLTFRGRLRNMESLSTELATVYFAPRKVAASLSLVNPYYWGHLTKNNKTLAKKGIAQMTQFMATVALTVSAVNWLMDDEDENKNIYNSYHPDYMQLKIGRTRIDLTGGLKVNIVFGSRFLMGQYMTTSSPQERELGQDSFTPTRWDLTMMYNESKFNPTMSMVRAKLSETKHRKEDWDEILKENTRPMWVSGGSELFEAQPTLFATALTALSVTGLNSNTYGGPEFLDPKDPANKKYERLFNVKGLSVYTPTKPNVRIYDTNEGKERVVSSDEYEGFEKAYSDYMANDVKVNYDFYKDTPALEFEKHIKAAKKRAKDEGLLAVSDILAKNTEVSFDDKKYVLNTDQIKQRIKDEKEFMREFGDLKDVLVENNIVKGMTKGQAEMEAKAEMRRRATKYATNMIRQKFIGEEIELEEKVE